MPLKDLLFGFEGRTRRRDWWIWGIATGVAYFAVFALVGGLLFGPAWSGSLFGGSVGPGSWPMTLFSLVSYAPLLWVQTALAAKRAHDRNWGALIPAGLTVLCGAASFAPEIVDLVLFSRLTDQQFNTLYGVVNVGTGAVNLGLMVVLGFQDGTPGPNRFGRSPKGIGGDTADRAAEVFS
jgi:uncharacterized membrane protein YhaH (DUF805 family)